MSPISAPRRWGDVQYRWATGFPSGWVRQTPTPPPSYPRQGALGLLDDGPSVDGVISGGEQRHYVVPYEAGTGRSEPDEARRSDPRPGSGSAGSGYDS